MPRELVVTAVGAVTPVGLSAPAACAALRAGVARLTEVEVFADGDRYETFGPVVVGRTPLEWFDGGPAERKWPGHERFGVRPPPPEHLIIPSGPSRLALLARHAAEEALAAAKFARPESLGLGLYLGLSSADEPGPISDALRSVAPAPFALEVHQRDGRPAALLALGQAVADLEEERIDCALVGGVDSLLRREVLRKIDGQERLKSALAPQGFIPGEAAGFFVVEARRSALSRGIRPLAGILGVGSSREDTDGSDRPSQGEALTRALRLASVEIDGSSARPLVVCDLNGERHRSMEWGIVSTRLSHRFGGFEDLWHPADCVGDTGAASGALNALWACTALRRGYAGTRHALVWGASDDGPRAAAAFLSLED